MKSLCVIQNGGLGMLGDAASDKAARIKVLQDRISVLNADLLTQYQIIKANTQGIFTMDLVSGEIRAAAVAEAYRKIDQIQIELNALQLELNGLLGEAAAADAAYQSSPSGIVNANKKTVDDFRNQMFLLSRPGFDYGFNSEKRNNFFNRDLGLGFDLFGAVVSSLKTNAPEAFKGVKGSTVFASIVPNAGGSSITAPKISLPSWIPRISLPKPLQDAARAAANLATSTAKDVAAKKRAADAAASASGAASQTSDYPAPQSSNNSVMWILGGAAILSVAFVATRRK